ncbi:two-component system regulatory protein YycI [Rossellomorea aquimaris]|uniref:two-component system regulatory protein YycI n=1 Tax=Rossellomorea aquimaris TaxID=189382 RepID=UPI0007D0A1C1|nr:two-component system regulatory protein YycI [Rossellomorea aquimaris]
MDWSKTKSIFIVVFLILDIFLLSLFINKLSNSNPETLGRTNFEDILKADKIEYPSFSKDLKKEAYISAKTKKFTTADIDEFEEQEINIVNDNTIHSTLSKPYPLSDKRSPEELKDFMTSFIIDGEKYRFWKYNEEDQTIVYYQTYKDKFLFHNINGEVTLNLTKENEIVSYKQTMLEDVKAFSGEKKSVYTPIQALQIFYENNKIASGSKVENVELGYSTLLPKAESQFLTPTWHFTVKNGDNKEDLFLNAFEGEIIEFTRPDKE